MPGCGRRRSGRSPGGFPPRGFPHANRSVWSERYAAFPPRSPAGHRRQPAGLQRESVHRTRLPGPDQGAAPPRRTADRHRPAAHPYGQAGRRASRGPARHRRTAALRDGPCPLRGGPGGPGGAAEHLGRLDEVERLAADFPPEAVAPLCDIPAERIRRLARELAAAETAAVYGRIGSTTVEFGTLTSWLVDVLAVLTGNFDRPGGLMFPLSATGPAPRPAADSPWAAGTAGSPATPRPSPNCPSSRWPRRSTPPARAASGPPSSSPPTRSSPSRTATVSTPRSPRSTSW